ncbi:MAG: DUF4422 domain-containing protein [Clostridia bacterium]|nr:DUF4422 domain-containing protein [Clostridia bacterium]
MKDIKLWVVTHKKKNISYPYRTYIKVGNGENNTDMVTDATGDNIAEKNKNYCELTAIYWIWKNTNCDIVGIEHYRRVFGFNLFDVKNYFILKPKKIEKVLKKYSVICPKKFKFKDTLLNRYRQNFDENDFDIIRRIIDEKYPDYLNSYDYVMNSNFGTMCNMMICSKELFNSYCEWLFDILFESEKYIDPSNRDAYRARVFGFLSERLLNIWLVKNELKVKYVSVIRTDGGRFKGLIGVFITKIKCLLQKKIVKVKYEK